MLKAIEDGAAILACIHLLEAKFASGSRLIPGFGTGALWQERLGVWARFSESGRRTVPGRYWNVFGRQPSRLRENMIVEINPPSSGRNLNRQGVVATDRQGHRWVLHQGRLHPGGMVIDEGMFDEVAGSAARVKVHYTDGTVASCHPVTDLDQPPAQVQEDLAAFVALCARVRVYYQISPVAAGMLKRIEVAEGPSTPELQGEYQKPGSEPTTVRRRHADVWHALADTLNELGVKHSNDRVGRYGPDLLASSGHERCLFEIKTGVGASDIQRALGQLQLYEHLGGRTCTKIMVLPKHPRREIAAALEALGIQILEYSRRGKAIAFEASALKRALSKPRGRTERKTSK